MQQTVHWIIFFDSLIFICLLTWYLVAENARSRRIAGMGCIITAMIMAGLSIYTRPLTLGLDLQGGVSFTLELEAKSEDGQLSESAVQQAVEVLQKRLDSTGARNVSIQPVGTNRLTIQIPGLDQEGRKEVEAILSRVASLEFRLVHPRNDQLMQEIILGGGELPVEERFEWEILPMQNRDATGEIIESRIVVGRKVVLSGKRVIRAFRGADQIGKPDVNLRFDSKGTEMFADLTRANVNRQMAIVLDGIVQSAPRINEPITGGFCQISGGNMTVQEAEELANVLENPLDTKPKIVLVNGVTPTLGKDSVERGFEAFMIALCAVIAFMVAYYRLAGLVSIVALVGNLILLFGLFAQFGFTLTLPGLAGIVLTIGMAVDANVLIYERIRDELRAGKPTQNAVDLGFEKAWSAIFDSNITTLIPAIILMYLGSGPLRGFAVTLTLGIVANLFTALVLSRNCFDWMLAYREFKSFNMMSIFRNPGIGFLGYRHIGMFISIVILSVGAYVFYLKGDSLLGVDFTGGDAVAMSYKEMVPVGDIRQTLDAYSSETEPKEIDVNLVQYAPEASLLMIQTKFDQGETAEKVLTEAFPNAGLAHEGIDSVGPSIGDELKERAVWALGLGLLGILVFAALRFDWSYAVAAAIGQIHDVFIALVILAFFDVQLTLALVGAFLTIAGYSINDKIVIFDRVREQLHLKEKMTLYDVIDLSLNLSFARTVITSLTTALAIGALMIFGGPMIYDFALAMLIGVITGIYSSHFISSPIAWWIDRYKDKSPYERQFEQQAEAHSKKQAESPSPAA